MTTSPRRPTPASRAVRRSRRPAPRSTTFLERNRSRLLWAGGIAAFVALAFVGLVLPSITPAFDCVNTFDPSPAPSFVAPSAAPVGSGATAAPAVTPPPPGYVEPDMGHLHVNTGDKVTYTYCPPASGKHYNAAAAGQGPIPAGVYGPDDKTVPQGWVHNLEHGALVVLYRCPDGGCTDEGQAALEAFFAQLPPTPICKIPAAQLDVFARFDDMAWPYAAIVWDVILPLQTLDQTAILDFYARQGEQFNPERSPTCVAPSPTPGPVPPTPAATGTAAPSGTAAPAPSASTAPAGS